MKISFTDIYRFSIPMEPFTISTVTMHSAQNVFIRVHTDMGFYGVGECSAFPMITGETQDTCLSMARIFAAAWKDKDPLDIETRMQELHNIAAYNFTIKSAFDMALYDIAAKAKDEPLYKFLKGNKRPVQTDITIGIAKPDEMAAMGQQYKQAGADIIKIKLGKNVIDDLIRVKKIREKVGKEVTLRIDANQGWSFEDAVKALQGMQDYNIQFCEQPMRSWNDDRLPELCKLSPIKIMADESCFDHHDASRLIRNNACDYINIKFAKSGGILEAFEIYQTAEDTGMSCMIGAMLESRVALSAKLHFAYACPGIKFFDLDSCMLGHLEDPCVGGLSYNRYLLDISDAPGIGADADNKFLEKCEKWRI
jgi:L-alanine-DL-glutamate epimerase-like enolase superfamily enzyme